MSEVKLDIVVETAEALTSLETFGSLASDAFERVGKSAGDAAESVNALAARIGGLPRSAITYITAIDDATPAIEMVRTALATLPADKWVTIHARYDMGQPPGAFEDPFAGEFSFSAGIDRVPRDMLATIHKGEAVLPPGEAGAYRALKRYVGELADGLAGAGDTPLGQTVNIRNLNITQLNGAGTGRRAVRRNVAPELNRLTRRAGRGGA